MKHANAARDGGRECGSIVHLRPVREGKRGKMSWRVGNGGMDLSFPFFFSNRIDGYADWRNGSSAFNRTLRGKM